MLPSATETNNSTHLAGVDGAPAYVAIKGTVYDVSGKDAYKPGGSYAVFAGKDASRALGMTSMKAEDVRADWEDLPEEQKKVLEDWQTFFSKRYNVVGKVVRGA
jgi:membrane-associated progesterone receptor component